jgi:hypothetical protein
VTRCLYQSALKVLIAENEDRDIDIDGRIILTVKGTSLLLVICNDHQYLDSDNFVTNFISNGTMRTYTLRQVTLCIVRRLIISLK